MLGRQKLDPRTVASGGRWADLSLDAENLYARRRGGAPELSRENLKSLTSLRFAAAASIVWLHATLYFDWAQAGPNLPFAHGVSFFFVLSGFILTHVHGSGKLSYRDFMLGRIARLWPLHIVCLIAVYWFVRADSQVFDGTGLANRDVSFVINALLLQSWVPTNASVFSWNSVAWSISTEMFFYAMFPLLIVLLSRTKWLFVAICVLPIAALWALASAFQVPPTGDVFTVTVYALFYTFPPSRLLEFGLGIVTCRIWQRGRAMHSAGFGLSTAIEVTALLLLCIWLAYIFPVLVGPSQWSVVFSQWFAGCGSCFAFAIFIAMMASGRGAFGKILGWGPFVLLGDASFALYMVHMIVMKVITLDGLNYLTAPAVVFPICLVAAFAGHFLIEKPGRKLIVQGFSRLLIRKASLKASAVLAGVPSLGPSGANGPA